MAVGAYGTVRAADVSVNDMEIFYQYSSSRTSQGTQLISLDPNQVISRYLNPNNSSGVELFGGLYRLNLPVSQFSNKGYYTIYIKPKEIRTRIVDCGFLESLPDIKGILLDNNTLGGVEDSSLIGYRVEYLDETGGKIPNKFTVITSNNKVELITQQVNDSLNKAFAYRLNPTSEVVFCTVTPNSAPSVRPNLLPDIGNKNQDIILTNTFFDPIVIELELVDHDIETLAWGIFGNQAKSVEDGVYTIYNFNNDIYKQYDLYEIKEQFQGTPLYEIREEKDSIDTSKEFNNISNV